jgi:hypothetical protein
MLKHIHDATKALATPLCGATTGVCMDNDESNCSVCIRIYRKARDAK